MNGCIETGNSSLATLWMHLFAAILSTWTIDKGMLVFERAFFVALNPTNTERVILWVDVALEAKRTATAELKKL